MKLKFFILLFFLSAGFVLSQNRPTPLENPILRTDMNANQKNITNLNAIVFSQNGTNVSIDISTFLQIYKGESKKLIDINNEEYYVFVQDSVPYLVSSNGTKRITINAETPYIRQNEPAASVSNLVVFQDLILKTEDNTDDNDYSVTYQVLTNNSIPVITSRKIVIDNGFSVFVQSGKLNASNFITHVVTPLTP